MNRPLCSISFFIAGLCIHSANAQVAKDGIYYSSLNYAVQQGQFAGVAGLKEFLQNGDFGLGSQHELAGELVLLHGNAYKISTDGKAERMPDTATLAFGATKFFMPEINWTVNKPLNMQQLQSLLDSSINTSMFAAIKITGSFRSIQYKCYYPQQKPYPSIKETPAKFFDSTNSKGVLVGFFTPRSALVLNSPNYHFHFLNEPATSGGHAEDFIINDVIIEIDYANSIQVKLPVAAQVKDIRLNEPMKQ